MAATAASAAAGLTCSEYARIAASSRCDAEAAWPRGVVAGLPPVIPANLDEGPLRGRPGSTTRVPIIAAVKPPPQPLRFRRRRGGLVGWLLRETPRPAPPKATQPSAGEEHAHADALADLRGRLGELQQKHATASEVVEPVPTLPPKLPPAWGSPDLVRENTDLKAELERLRREVDELKDARPQASGMTTEMAALGAELGEAKSEPEATHAPAPSRRGATRTAGRYGLILVVIAACVALPLFGVQRSSCGNRADPRYDWSVGVPFIDPGAGCFKRETGYQVIAGEF